ncbi:MAG: hypothetical protein JWP58_555, partial [Hymenobacter sp.]|nr:hypothetical protein [Hymenobacter sp.]
KLNAELLTQVKNGEISVSHSEKKIRSIR